LSLINTLKSAYRWQEVSFGAATGYNRYGFSFFYRLQQMIVFGTFLSEKIPWLVELDDCLIHAENITRFLH
jgi:hypothetical protein